MQGQEGTLFSSPKVSSSMSVLLCLLDSLMTIYNLAEGRTEGVKLWHFITLQDKRIPLLQLLSSPRGHSPPYGCSSGGFFSWKNLWTTDSLMTRQHFLTNFSQQFSVTTTLSICHRLPSVEPRSYSSLWQRPQKSVNTWKGPCFINNFVIAVKMKFER